MLGMLLILFALDLAVAYKSTLLLRILSYCCNKYYTCMQNHNIIMMFMAVIVQTEYRYIHIMWVSGASIFSNHVGKSKNSNR